ncbi:hypothetical protein ABZ646_45555 [Streptomyces sp. NPDC007162]|uniref:hypothetical protein n=1 Tax=Streptomyces sp. NPDC007162 TaxID=3156917 RepID=UPI0033EA3465
MDGVIQKVHELEADYRAAARQVSKELDKAGDIAPDEPGFWDKLGKESGETDQEVVAQGIKALLLRDPLREVTWLDLPCGPAVCGVSFQKLVVDGGYTKSGQDEELIMGQIQVHIPFATGPYTAVFTLDTASVEQWDEFAHAVAGIVGSVEFPPSTAPAGLPD